MMTLEVGRYELKIRSGVFWSDQDVAYIEDTLNLKSECDYIKLVRVNASGLSCPAYLKTVVETEEQRTINAFDIVHMEICKCMQAGEARDNILKLLNNLNPSLSKEYIESHKPAIG